MKHLVTALALGLSLNLLGQKDDEDIVYYTDSRVFDSRFGLALNLNPTYTDLRIINDEVGLGGGGFNIEAEEVDARGTFQFNYHLELLFELSENFALSAGFGRASGGYTIANVLYADSIPASDDVAVSMYTVPIKIHFSTEISDVFDLEVVPTVELNFLDRYEATFRPKNGSPSFTEDYTEFTQDLNYSVGIGLGGTYWFGDRWGVFVRGSIKYMLNQMVGLPDFPRETLINYGLNTGIRVAF